jgi:hypothetical protein
MTASANRMWGKLFEAILEVNYDNPHPMNSVLRVIFERALVVRAHRQGNPSEDWENLLLLLLTQHFAETLGRPFFFLAGCFLEAVSGNKKDIYRTTVGETRKQQRQNFTSRVGEFKTRYPEWPAFVEAFLPLKINETFH